MLTSRQISGELAKQIPLNFCVDEQNLLTANGALSKVSRIGKI
jgi:hypothetical protein